MRLCQTVVCALSQTKGRDGLVTGRMGRFVAAGSLGLLLLCGAACGDDTGSTDRGGSPPVAGGSDDGTSACLPGFTESPSSACDCQNSRRVCKDDGTWGECVCPEVDPCLNAVGWRCDNPCPGDPPDAEPRILQCVDGKPPTCECPES